MSYKLFDFDDFLSIFQKPEIIKKQAVYHGEKETDDSHSVLDAEQLLEKAKSHAEMNTGQHDLQPTSKSEIYVGYGEGRATREIELIWWPDLYRSSHGKLAIRFYVQKVNL